LGRFRVALIAVLVGCGPSADDASPGDVNGDGIECAALDEVDCGLAMSSGLAACAWVEVHRFADPHALCESTTTRECIEMNLSTNEGCLPTSCSETGPSVFVRESADGSIEVVSGPFCGNEPLGFGRCTEATAAACSCFCGGAFPAECASDPFGDVCRDAFARRCASVSDELLCRGSAGVGDGAGTNLMCTWLSPARWTIEGDTCTSVEDAPRCVAGHYVGDGGIGCSSHYDPADPGPGVVIASSPECAGPYDWTPCEADDAPPECGCGP
jgi:hypothetical protein